MPVVYFTEHGKKIVSSVAYAKTGAPMYIKGNPKNQNSKTFIYILYLDHNKKYIGKTTNFIRRMKEHFTKRGSQVTKKFKPIKGYILNTCNGYFANKLEQYYTKKYIKIYGYENVRGGYYTNSKTLQKQY